MLDEAGFDRALSEDADEALTLLADLTGATDAALRERARRLAGRLVLDLARPAAPRRRGIGRLRRAPADREEGDLDIDASLEPLLLARAGGPPPALDELSVRAWGRHDLAVCLLVDRSGSMGGDRLATAALAAAACAWRAGADWSLCAFSDRVLVLKSQDEGRGASAVVDDVLALRGFGPTDLSLALRTASAQLGRSRAGRRLTVLLSDCRPTAGEDPQVGARLLDDLVIVAPEDDCEDAAELARAVGARWVGVGGPASIPTAFSRLLDR
ncbi:MAG: VWA domain-containing protein [Acidimicrobiia bacterium]|nr:VWA domain-containing protein [Acidimicrobiia bacterium]